MLLMFAMITSMISDQKHDIAEFKNKLKDDWTKIDARYSVPFRLEFSHAEHVQPKNKKDMVVVPRKFSCIIGNDFFISKRVDDSNNPVFVFAVNKDYIFQVRRLNSTDPWNVTDVTTDKDTPFARKLQSGYTLMLRPDSTFFMFNPKEDSSLLELINNGIIEIKSISMKDSICRINFVMPYHIGEDYKTIITGFIECDAGNMFSLTKIEYSTVDGHIVHGINEYAMQPAKDGYRPCISTSRILTVPDGTKLVRKYTYDFQQIESFETNQFYLRHYGLLEPDQQVNVAEIPDTKTNYFFWILSSLAVILFLCSIYFRHLSIRKLST